MYCSKCGTYVGANSTYCNKCGCQLKKVICSNKPQNNFSPIKNKNIIFASIGLVIIVLLMALIFGNSGTDYYFSDDGYSEENDNTTIDRTNPSTTKKGKNSTIIISDNVYNGITISGVEDANELITKDSIDQKKNCPKEILQVENEIIEKYGITAVNLCEMDVEFARELQSVFEVIYNEYPAARGHITNLTLRNTSMLSEAGVIAAFMPIFNFATSNSSTTYPWVIKTQILLSSSYFLNKKKLEASVNDGSASGHFPPNATLYSPVAHELGHYISFLAMLNNYNVNSILLIDSNNANTLYDVYKDFAQGHYSLEILKEAYNVYKVNAREVLDFDEWRGTISKYALAKNNSGEYIYDETIAEAFHDVYLNKENAKDASKYIVSILKKKLES